MFGLFRLITFLFLLTFFYDFCWVNCIFLIESLSEAWFRMSFSLLILIDRAFRSLDNNYPGSCPMEALRSRLAWPFVLLLAGTPGEISFSFCMYD